MGSFRRMKNRKKPETDKRRKPRLLLDVEVDAYPQKTTEEVV